MTMEQENALLRRALLGAAALDLGALRDETPPLSSRQAKRMKAMLADPFGYARRFRVILESDAAVPWRMPGGYQLDLETDTE